jgi:dephospho-CoA kinase
MFKNKKYNLIITGTIGVGKSTVLQLISDILEYYSIKINKYPEYITYNQTGKLLFEMKMNNKISTFTFQNYILDIWDTLLTENDFKNSKSINIFERIPYDAVYCFSEKEYSKGNLSKAEYGMILTHYESILHKHNMFEYSDQFKFSRINNDNINHTISTIINTIIDDINNGHEYRCICLSVDDKNEYYKRLGIRNRTSEDKYTCQILDEYSDYYRLDYSHSKDAMN